MDATKFLGQTLDHKFILLFSKEERARSQEEVASHEHFSISIIIIVIFFKENKKRGGKKGRMLGEMNVDQRIFLSKRSIL